MFQKISYNFWQNFQVCSSKIGKVIGNSLSLLYLVVCIFMWLYRTDSCKYSSVQVCKFKNIYLISVNCHLNDWMASHDTEDRLGIFVLCLVQWLSSPCSYCREYFIVSSNLRRHYKLSSVSKKLMPKCRFKMSSNYTEWTCVMNVRKSLIAQKTCTFCEKKSYSRNFFSCHI